MTPHFSGSDIMLFSYSCKKRLHHYHLYYSVRQKSFLCLRYNGLKVGGRPGICFGLKVPVHGRGLLGDFTVILWRAGEQILLLQQHLWGDGMKSQLLEQISSQSHTHPGGAVCLAVVSAGCFNVWVLAWVFPLIHKPSDKLDLECMQYFLRSSYATVQ